MSAKEQLAIQLVHKTLKDIIPAVETMELAIAEAISLLAQDKPTEALGTLVRAKRTTDSIAEKLPEIPVDA